MNRDDHVAPERERTFAMSGWQKFLLVGGAIAPLGLAGAIFSVYLAGQASVTRPEGMFVPLLGLLMLGLSAIGIRNALQLSRSTIRIAPSGLSAGAGDAAMIPWDAIRGARRHDWRMVTDLTGAPGEVLATVNDRIESAPACLEAIADAAHLERPALPVSHALRGVPVSYLMLLFVLVTAMTLLGVGKLDLFGMIMTVVMAGIFAFVATLEVTGLAVEEEGVVIRRAFVTETFGWDEISHCGFRLVTMRDSRWVEAVLETPRGTRKLAPLGTTALPIVALIRARLRQGRFSR
ncbi:MAG: hypothetical protein IT348_13875 [Candidatus Eisenbacteria bacterium]|nr:hypothetical protein [Candidatus Eisenbacteria bacterium]